MKKTKFKKQINDETRFSRQITEKCETKYGNGNYIWDTHNGNENNILGRREYIYNK